MPFVGSKSRRSKKSWTIPALIIFGFQDDSRRSKKSWIQIRRFDSDSEQEDIVDERGKVIFGLQY
jgi:hypothetical protein